MKTKSKPAAGTTEKRLIKALNAVEKAAVPKQMRDANGGFSTEGDGDELQVSAEEDAEPKNVKKGRRRGDEEESSVVKADEESGDEESSEESSDDEESSDEESSPPMALSRKKGKGGKSKAVKKGGKSKEESSEESSAETSEELSGEESIGESPKPVKKGKKGKSVKKSSSIKKSLMADEGNADVVNASEFIEQLLDSVSDSNAALTKSVRDQRVEQQEFNGMMAKAITLLGNVNLDQSKQLKRLRKALESVPMTGRGKTLLNKSDVAERQFEQPEGVTEELDDQTYRQAMDVLVTLATKNQVKPELVTQFEMSKSLDVLPPNVREMIQGSLH